MQKLFANPKHWIKGWFAKDANGGSVKADSVYATCWCLIGGIRHCYPEKQRADIENKIVAAIESEFPQSAKYLYRKYGQLDIADWNDASIRTIDQIQRVVKAANV
jgi:hypothetical protein